MRSKLVATLLLIFAVSAASCRSKVGPPASTEAAGGAAAERYQMSAEAYAYIESALAILESNFIYRDQIDWEAVRIATLQKATGSATATATHQAIQVAILQLNDPHTRFLSSELLRAQDEEWQPLPIAELVQDRFGLIRFPRCCTPGYDGAYAESAQASICEVQAAAAPCGWIVDLHLDDGGNMWPMLAGIGPILDEGPTGAFQRLRENSFWSYQDGAASLDGEIQFQVDDPICPLEDEHPPVALIIGPNTMSAGEAIVVAFRGRPNTRSFGEATAGLTTGVSEFELSDGAVIALSTSLLLDRDGLLYDEPLQPDTFIRLGSGSGFQNAIQAAAVWLKEQPACSDGG
jgi:C-terminal processing protease CtpA/Prc